MKMPQAPDQASMTPNQRHCRAKGGREGGQRPSAHFQAWGSLPRGAVGGAEVTGNMRCPISGFRAQAVPTKGLATSLTAQPRSTETSPPTPPLAERREDAELGLPSGGHRPGHGQGGKLWTKFRVATGGGVGKAKPRPVELPVGRHWGPSDRAPTPSELTHPLHLLGPHSPRPSRLS